MFNAPTNEIFFASSVFVPESSFNHTNRISKINMTLVEQALAAGLPDINIPFQTVSISFHAKSRELMYVLLARSSRHSSNNKRRDWSFQRFSRSCHSWAR